MKIGRTLTFGVPLLTAILCAPALSQSPAPFPAQSRAQSPAQSKDTRVIRIAGLEIDPSQAAAYTAALKAEIEASLRIEPGVLTLYAVSVKDHPERIRLFEIYRDKTAYQSHLQSPHFLHYKQATLTMVKSLNLLETTPILVAASPK